MWRRWGLAGREPVAQEVERIHHGVENRIAVDIRRLHAGGIVAVREPEVEQEQRVDQDIQDTATVHVSSNEQLSIDAEDALGVRASEEGDGPGVEDGIDECEVGDVTLAGL